MPSSEVGLFRFHALPCELQEQIINDATTSLRPLHYVGNLPYESRHVPSIFLVSPQFARVTREALFGGGALGFRRPLGHCFLFTVADELRLGALKAPSFRAVQTFAMNRVEVHIDGQYRVNDELECWTSAPANPTGCGQSAAVSLVSYQPWGEEEPSHRRIVKTTGGIWVDFNHSTRDMTVHIRPGQAGRGVHDIRCYESERTGEGDSSTWVAVKDEVLRTPGNAPHTLSVYVERVYWRPI